jgi:hypothetical protein
LLIVLLVLGGAGYWLGLRCPPAAAAPAIPSAIRSALAMIVSVNGAPPVDGSGLPSAT